MYTTSETYKSTMNSGVIRNRIEGTMTLTDGTVVTIDDSKIVSGSLSIDNKCVNNTEFSLGSVYVGQMNLSLYDEEISRYSLYNAKVMLSYFLTLSDDTEEEIPLGIFYVEKATRSRKLIALTCYDSMTDLDVNVDEDTWGTPFELLTYVCSKTGIELSNSKTDIESRPNGTELFTLRSDKISTYRDFISYLSIVLCGFATINRSGELEIRSFHTESDMSISASRRTDSIVHDYETFFRSVGARFIAEQNFYPYYEEDSERQNGLFLDLGDLPIVQGVESTKHNVLKSILAELETIRYTPSEVKMVSDPSIDLGDALQLLTVNGTTDNALIVVTALTWVYRAEQSITSNGTDALLENIADQNRRQIQTIESELNSKNVVVKTFTNSANLTLNSTEQNIIRIAWSAFEDTIAIFVASIEVDMLTDGNLVLNYYKTLVNVGTWTKYLTKGKHIVTVSTYIPSAQAEQVSWTVGAKTEYFESCDRIHDAKIISLWEYATSGTLNDPVIDTTVPTGTIDQEKIKATVFAQGLNSTIAWDGTIEIVEEVNTVELLGLDVDTNIIESVMSSFKTPDRNGFSDVVTVVDLDSITVDTGIEESIDFDRTIPTWTFRFTGTDNTEVVDGVIKMKNSFVYNGEAETIDEGQLIGVQIMTSDKQEITELGVVVE